MGRRRKHRRFSPEFKTEAVRLVTSTSEPIAKIARDLGVAPQSLRAWMNAARPAPATPLTEDERSELLRLRRELRRVEQERDILKKATAFFRPAERVIFAFILTEKAHYPVRTLCAVLQVSPSGYYAWRGRPLVSPQVRANRALQARIRAIHAASHGRYGSPRIHRALQDDGERVGRRRMMRQMRLTPLRGRPRRRFRLTTQADALAAPAAKPLQQRFAVAAPNRVWTADITALPTGEGWLYLAVLLDLDARRIVGWAVRPTLETELVCAAWHQAIAVRTVPRGLLHHSDRGCQYTSAQYQALLRSHGVICSMSRRGNCFDNAPTKVCLER